MMLSEVELSSAMLNNAECSRMILCHVKCMWKDVK